MGGGWGGGNHIRHRRIFVSAESSRETSLKGHAIGAFIKIEE